VIFVTFWALSIVLAAVCGFFIGPIFFYNHLPCLQNGLCGLFCPVFMALGSVVGALGAFGFGSYILFMGSVGIFLTLRTLWCNCDQPAEPDFIGEELL
jgi:hypothetical protein